MCYHLGGECYHLGWECYHLGLYVIIWDESFIIGWVAVIIWEVDVTRYHLVCVIIWEGSAIIWDGRVIIWGKMLSSGMGVLSSGNGYVII